MGREEWIALSLQRHVGGRTFQALLAHFDEDPAAVLAADAQQLQRVPGVGPKIAQAIQQIRLPALRREMAAWEAAGVRILLSSDPAYPEALRRIHDGPPTLFVLGNWLPALWEQSSAIVGTRNPGAETRRLALQLARNLAEAGQTIISGLALGIDIAAHRGAMAAPGGTTMAVLGSGVLNIYPPEHARIAQEIRWRGTLLSEWHPGISAAAARLVPRNRIISGLSRRLIVVETSVDGGAMYAARAALAQGRPLYTYDLPASGNQALLAQGAQPLRPGDIPTLD